MDDFLNGGFMNQDDDAEDSGDEDSMGADDDSEMDEEDAEEHDDNDDFASVDEIGTSPTLFNPFLLPLISILCSS